MCLPPAPCLTGIEEIAAKLSEESPKVLKKLNHKFVMQELASVSRARDYMAHLEDKVARESGFVEYLLLKQNLKTLSEIETKIYKESDPIFANHLRENLEQVRDIEANLRIEAWTVTTKLDTIVLKLWL